MKVFATLKTRCGCRKEVTLTEAWPSIAEPLTQAAPIPGETPRDPHASRLFDLYSVTYGPADLVTATYVERA